MLSRLQHSALRVFILMPVLPQLGACQPPPPPAAGEVEEEEQAPPSPPAPDVLLLDHDVRHPAFWADVILGLEAAGTEVTYRRFFPHLTAADVAPDRYTLIVVAAGGAPAAPATSMRLDEAALAAEYVAGGGTLVLAPLATQADSGFAENEWTLMNRTLELAGAALRVDRGVLIGTAFIGDPAPPHSISDAGYATSLEPTLGYAYGQTFPGEWSSAPSYLLPVGRSPRLIAGSPDVSVLVATREPVYLWRTLGGDPETRIEEHTDPQLIAAVAPTAEGGHVAVIPKSLLLLSGVTGELSDKPVPDAGRHAQLLEFTDDLLAYLVRLGLGDDDVKVTLPLQSAPLFSAGAPGLEALDASSSMIANTAVDVRAVPDAPPEGDLTSALRLSDEQLIAGWASPGGARLGYAELPNDPARTGEFLAEADAWGLDVLLTTTSPERLVNGTFSPEGVAGQEAMIAGIAADADALEVSWFVGSYLSQQLLDMAAPPTMRGPLGQDGHFAALTHAPLWEEGLLRTFDKVGELAAAYPGIDGVSLDVELYGGPVQHRELFAFSDPSWQLFIARADVDAAVLDALNALDANARLPALVDEGLLGVYLQVLEDAVAAWADQALAAARQRAPELEVSVYMASFPDSWFHRGLLRGLSSDARPVTVLSYEVWTSRASRALAGDGVPFVHLGGTLLGYWRPSDFDDVLVELARGSDGYWFLGARDLSVTHDGPALHGEPATYIEAISRAHDALQSASAP